MKAYIKQLFSLAALTSVFFAQAEQCGVTSAFQPRSQSRDWARQMVGVTQYIHQPDSDMHGFFSITPVYTQSFKPKSIAHCLVGKQDECNGDSTTVLVQGSQVKDRNDKAWLADNFYLPIDFSGSFTIKPRIQNFLVDLDFYLGLDDCLCGGTWLWIYGPITWTKWDLNFCESVVDTGTQNHPAGYFAPTEVTREKLLPDFASYVNGCNKPSDIDDSDVGTITFKPLQFTRMDGKAHSKTGFADLRFNLGWDFLQSDCGHLGIYFTTAFPTGNHRKSCHLFEPIIGNGHHWELGGGLTAHYLLWDSECYDYQVNFYFNTNVTHLFGARQKRTFDVCNRPNSRYLLTEKLTAPVTGLFGAPEVFPAANGTNDVVPSAQFKNEYAPLANLTTLDVSVSVPAEAEIVALFNIEWCNSSLDIGYNFWGRACEKISCPKPSRNCDDVASLCDPKEAQQWALKGDSRVFGFVGGTGPSTTPIPLSATQRSATICSALNTKADDTNEDPYFNRNAAVDNRAFAYNTSGSASPLVYAPGIVANAENQLYTSLNPEFIKCNDLNYQATRGISHRIFAHYSYNWLACDCYNTFLGFGGSAEFGKTSKKDCPTTATTGCDKSCGPCFYVNDPCKANCIDCSLSQWAVWLKGGVAF